jgi:uncharacterized protein YigE (DUF2233 family)
MRKAIMAAAVTVATLATFGASAASVADIKNALTKQSHTYTVCTLDGKTLSETNLKVLIANEAALSASEKAKLDKIVCETHPVI